MRTLKPLFFLVLTFFLAACGSAAPATEAPAEPGGADLPVIPFAVTITPEIAPFRVPLESPTALPTQAPRTLETATALPSASPTQAASPTPAASSTAFGPTPTETLLPPLELPTERPNAPLRLPWTGLPTYPGDSEPDLLFRVDYNPDLWAQTEGNYGDIVLAHRQIEYCTITPWSGRGLPMDWKVEHDFRYIGSAAFDVNTVLFQGRVQFVAYVGGDRRVLTGFQVSFEGNSEQCLADAEVIFGTLRSLAAVPTPTPTLLPESPTPETSAGSASTTPTP